MIFDYKTFSWVVFFGSLIFSVKSADPILNNYGRYLVYLLLAYISVQSLLSVRPIHACKIFSAGNF